ncbi:hypothetical protein Rhe02_38120 [Rhizocola hellebori]|uniref:Uncharacterized protein n=1 Tax=Rhizocola hellebori TaxID=1392758 RepID=A0A8J3Q8D5_9ACTN|nr:hypothetical protein [Rhizocola hellebori]GIH05745.1 hypothetical protein Rhe02_38120 [Rhizocola hellebori]
MWSLDAANSPELITRLRRHGRRVGFEVAWVGEGWRALVEQCHDRLVAAFPDYELLAIKQKWAVLEYQAFPSPWVDGRATWQEDEYCCLQRIVDEVKGESESVCEWCGAQARLRDWRTLELTLCDGCDAGFADPPWPLSRGTSGG